MDLRREKRLLDEYRVELADAERRLREAEADTSELRPIVTAMESRIRRFEAAQSGDELPPRPAEPEPATPPRSRSQRSVKQVLAELLADGKPRTTDEVADELAQMPAFQSKPPSQQTVTNRLFDLYKEAYLRRLDRGIYQLAIADQLASSEAHGNATEPRVQTEEPTPEQKPPGEEAAAPRPGHPSNGAGGSLSLALDTKAEGSTPSGSSRT